MAWDSALYREGADGGNVERLDKKDFPIPVGDRSKSTEGREAKLSYPNRPPSLNNSHCMNGVWKASN